MHELQLVAYGLGALFVHMSKGQDEIIQPHKGQTKALATTCFLLRELRAQSEARKEMVLSAISAVAGFVESGFTSLITNPATMRT
eukprot:scaffold267393_cov16-Prasinocladus_malaysianus.AAC.2